MAYLQLPITGTGTRDDPFRPNFPLTIPPITSISGFRWSAHIPSNPDGTPQFADCFLWIPDSISLPGGVTVVPLNTARNAIKNRDPSIKLDAIEMP